MCETKHLLLNYLGGKSELMEMEHACFSVHKYMKVLHVSLSFKSSELMLHYPTCYCRTDKNMHVSMYLFHLVLTFHPKDAMVDGLFSSRVLTIVVIHTCPNVLSICVSVVTVADSAGTPLALEAVSMDT